MALIRIHPFQYIHVLDNNTNTQRVEVGPQTFTKQDHETIIQQTPLDMITIPPCRYARIKDPYVRKSKDSKEAVKNKYGQAKIRHGDYEIRFSEDWQDPFFLYPGESMVEQPQPLEIVPPKTALRLKAQRDFVDENKEKRVAGDEWLFKGPATYRPKVQEVILNRIQAEIVQKGNGLKLQATKAFKDRKGIQREAGETWIIRDEGAYLPHVDEAVLNVVQPLRLKPTKAVHLKAIDSFNDKYGVDRKAGEEWLVTFDMSETHMLSVFEERKADVNITTLGHQHYCVILDPVGDDGRNQFGTRSLRRGETTFFLQPGERLEDGIQNAYVLSADESLLIKCNEAFMDTSLGGKPIERYAGQWWMVNGPCEYVPGVEVVVERTVKAIPLDKNEGIYVREYSTGDVRAEIGHTYMLKADEELWEKKLPAETELLIQSTKFSDDDGFGTGVKRKVRNKTRVVVYRVPHNSVVQIYDYKARSARVVLGPELVMLQPDEQFTVLSLSGKTPKKPNEIKTIAVRLGPDFMTDVIEVETMDHARLRLKLAFNWFFNIQDGDYSRVFVVRDFVGDACKAVASLVRGCAASVAFDVFHKNSVQLIREAVFGKEDGKIKDTFEFVANKLCVTNIDVQSVEPVDQSTRESLMKSVQLAIKITAQKQERGAKHLAQKTEQRARGQIEKQKILNQKNAEADKKKIY